MWYGRKILYILLGCLVVVMVALVSWRNNAVTRQNTVIETDASNAYDSALMTFLLKYQGSRSDNIEKLRTLFLQKLSSELPQSKVSKIQISNSFGIVADIQYPTWLWLKKTFVFTEQPAITTFSK